MTTASSRSWAEPGNWTGDDIPGILLEQPACAEWICRKLFRQFVSDSQSPSERLLAPLAQAFRESNYQIKVPVARILRSRLFFDAAVRRRRVKSPVEFAVGTIRSLEILNPTVEARPLPRPASPWVRVSMPLRASPAGMVDRPGSAPPRCSPAPTWPCDSSPTDDAGFGRRCNPRALAARHGAGRPDAAARFLLDLLVPDPLDPKVREPIVKAATSKDAGADAAVRDAARLDPDPTRISTDLTRSDRRRTIDAMPSSRRQFLQTSIGSSTLVAMGATTIPGFLSRSAQAAWAEKPTTGSSWSSSSWAEMTV